MPKAPEPTKQQLGAIKAYASLLDEARARLQVIEDLLTGRIKMPEPLVIEMIYLQFRMLCELIALGCLVVHGDLEATKTARLQKEFAADSILKKLEQLHANFYPRPVVMTAIPNGQHLDYIPDGFLTKEELIGLYHECGDRLHRGSLVKFNKHQPKLFQDEINKAKALFAKLLILLRIHHIASHNNLPHFVCILSSEQMNKNANVVLALSPLPDLSEGQDEAPGREGEESGLQALG